MGYYQRETMINIHEKKRKYNFLLSQKSIPLSEIRITTEKNLFEQRKIGTCKIP